jgi:Holliday junction resolvasome RuvABC ATP-dependent DNA helicase subunit
MPRERLRDSLMTGQASTQGDQRSGMEPGERRKRYGLSSIVGQRQPVERLRALVEFHSAHGRLPGHILLVGGDGMGKHTLARALAAELGSTVKEAEAGALKRGGDVVGPLADLGENGIFIVSNVGALRSVVTEFLRSAVVDGKVDFVVDKGMFAKTINLPLKPFILVGTCRHERQCPPELADALLPPVRLEAYSTAELTRICGAIARRVSVTLTPAAAEMIASQSHGTPRQVELLLKRLTALGTSIDEVSLLKFLSALGLAAPARGTSVEPLILDQLPSEGQTIIEKLENSASQVGFAVVLATPDDEGNRACHPDERSYRARQNVVLELGMLLSKLGRNKVAILLKQQDRMERPSDIQGLIYIPFRDDVKDAGVLLAKEMAAQGYRIDIRKL